MVVRFAPVRLSVTSKWLLREVRRLWEHVLTYVCCVMCVSYRRVQGLVKGLLNIDGRTKIAELERFLGEVLAHGKKTVAVAVFLVPSDNAPAATSSSTSYQKFVEEFTAAERAGLCNASPTVQVYLIPPALQGAVSVIRDIRMDPFPRQPSKPSEFQHQVLFAVIVSKEVAPPHFLSRTYPPMLLGKSRRRRLRYSCAAKDCLSHGLCLSVLFWVFI